MLTVNTSVVLEQKTPKLHNVMQMHKQFRYPLGYKCVVGVISSRSTPSRDRSLNLISTKRFSNSSLQRIFLDLFWDFNGVNGGWIVLIIQNGFLFLYILLIFFDSFFLFG